MHSAPTAGAEERSCCRSVLLMNYDIKLQDLKKCQVKRIFWTRFICRLLSLLEQQAEKWTLYLFFLLFFFKSLGCCSMDNVFFLLGLFISKQKQLTLGNFNGVALVHRSVDYDDDSFFFFYELRWYFCVNSWSIILYPFSLPPSRICSDMRISNSYLIIWVLIQREVVSVRHGYVRHLAQSQIWRSDQMHKK